MKRHTVACAACIAGVSAEPLIGSALADLTDADGAEAAAGS